MLINGKRPALIWRKSYKKQNFGDAFLNFYSQLQIIHCFNWIIDLFYHGSNILYRFCLIYVAMLDLLYHKRMGCMGFVGLRDAYWVCILQSNSTPTHYYTFKQKQLFTSRKQIKTFYKIHTNYTVPNTTTVPHAHLTSKAVSPSLLTQHNPQSQNAQLLPSTT